MYCQSCGMEVASNYKICPKCGGRNFTDCHNRSVTVSVPRPSINPSGANYSPDTLLKAFRIIVIVDSVTYILLAFSGIMNKEFRDFVASDSLSIIVSFIVLLTIVLVGLAVNLGLYRLRKWARIVFTLFSVLSLLMLFLPSNNGVLSDGLDGVVELVGWMTSGALAIMVWFSPLKTQFGGGSTR